MYFRQMLYERGKAMLPGFGEWTLENEPASIHPEEGLIYPPRLHVHFTHNPAVDAAPLVQFIAEWQNIIPAVAELQIKKFLRQLEIQFEQHHFIEIPLVGNLRQDENGVWIFSESPFLQEGLETLPLKPLTRAGVGRQKPEAEVSAAANVAESEQQPVATESQEPAGAAPYPFEDHHSRGKGWWIVLGVLLILVAVGWTAWDKGWFSSLQKKIWGDTTSLSIPAASQMPALPDSGMEHASNGGQVDSIKTYQLVVSAFADSLDAANFYRQLSSQWPNAELIRDTSSYQYLVTLSMSITAADTAKWVEQIQRIYGGHPYFLQH
ncbi:hypothetical protein SAMN05660895_2075 [Thermoflavifilum thermophilum]|uniref:CCDC81-like prokaryotic HU domain-containing protein n=2 Tax=Thermoflavifilum thermophilum TaxID=1393122 RepID=A0A1I7NJF9_9BACT|nr:hypothetical protein SAMN05660895_2075 [Thermoflavifilum thermophilum]